MGVDIIDFSDYNTYLLEMKYILIAWVAMCLGCVQPPSSVVVVPLLQDPSEVQINPLPHPFNLNGENPYAVWINGKKLRLDRKQTKALAKSLNLEFTQPPNTEAIHNGEGWLAPLNLEKNKNELD